MLIPFLIILVWISSSKAKSFAPGEFVHFSNVREKLFVSTDGQVQEILKGGVLVRVDPESDICEVYVQEMRATAVEDLFYTVNCSSLQGTDLVCPPAPRVPDTCGLREVECLAQSLFSNGYAVMDAKFPTYPNGPLTHAFAARKLEEMWRMAAAAGMDPDGLDFHFSDLSSRGPGRWEIRVRSSDLALSEPDREQESAHWLSRLWEDAEDAVILPVLHAAHRLEKEEELLQEPKSGCSRDTPSTSDSDVDGVCNSEDSSTSAVFAPVFDGVLVSVPGADTQHWHRDSGLNTRAPSHYTVYIPTTDVTASLGPTQFLPGTNRDFGFRFTDWTPFFDYCPTLRAPLLTAGSMLIWEYRTVHRGTRNVHHAHQDMQHQEEPAAGEEASGRLASRVGPAAEAMRAMLFRTYHLQGAWRDINMGDTSFYEEAAMQSALANQMNG